MRPLYYYYLEISSVRVQLVLAHNPGVAHKLVPKKEYDKILHSRPLLTRTSMLFISIFRSNLNIDSLVSDILDSSPA